VFATGKVANKQDKKRNKKSKGEKSVTEPKQQHGEASSDTAPVTPRTEKQMTKDHAKHEMRRATESWVSGHISTKEHSAVHDRAKHIVSGKRVHEFKGKTGERSFKGLR
jgi:hypothetical protein